MFKFHCHWEGSGSWKFHREGSGSLFHTDDNVVDLGLYTIMVYAWESIYVCHRVYRYHYGNFAVVDLC